MTVIESSQVQNGKLLIVGDLLIDRTYYVDVPKLSPEAPVPVAMLTGEPINTPGGAGLAAAFAATKKIPIIFGTYTSIKTASDIQKDYDIDIVCPSEKGTDINAVKIRYIDNERHYHLLRVDSDKIIPRPFSNRNQEEKWFSNLETIITNRNVKVLMLLDYRKGLLTKARSQRLIAMAKKYKIFVYVDSRCNNLQKFNGADIIKLNAQEFKEACQQIEYQYPSDLSDHIGVRYIIKTNGAEGAEMWDGYYSGNIPRKHITYRPDIKKHEGSPDVTGCGDVFDVTFCQEWGINKISFSEAIEIAVETATKFAYEPIGERLKCQK
jgi:D-beta-D-heptose 7-phosphate kinase/D-beta-D-heptose 1-phosphate adenosyltransferase